MTARDSTMLKIFLCCFFFMFSCEGVLAQIRYSIAEESKTGSVVGNIAKDLGFDVDKIKDRRFRIVSASNDRFLQINQDNGLLYVSGKIDREELCEKSSLCTVNLKTVAENPLEVHYIEVDIRDINDHSPIFPVREKHLDISENAVPQSTRVPLDAARDLDAGVNSLHKYILSANSHFELDVKTRGEDKIPFLLLKKPLDREHNSELHLTLTAYDGGKPERSGSVNITINVIDINDNAPVFDRQVYTVTIEENSPFGSSVVKLHATDLDEGANAQVVYAFDKSVMNKAFEKFEIDSNTGKITVKGLIDFEEQSVYEIDIQASDKGPVVLIGHCSVVINIKDVNDNVPQIDVTSLSNKILEDANPGAAIALIGSSDRDSGENGVVICTLIEDIPFELKPSFQKSMYSLVTKNPLPGARFQLQAAQDPDSGSNSIQNYRLSHNDHFRLEVKDRDDDGKIPLLLLQKPLDREITKKIKLIITAVDGGKPPRSGTMAINVDVLDINDNAPVFTKDIYTVMVNENVPKGSIVVQVNATDSDEGLNGEIVYSMSNNINNKIQDLFEINQITGDIIVKGLLDFEVKDKYEIDIQASDKGLVPMTSDKSVTIKIVDLNDNNPEIEVTSFTREIPEDSRSGTTVALISVSDSDSGMNGKVLCSVPENIPFKLMPSSHENVYSLVTESSLDRETTVQYDITILAKDTGVPPLSSVKTITVKVSDVNDNSPQFSLSAYTFYVMENNIPGTSLFSVTA
uniref:Cadherin domain-containing protein n=1 Tax=Astyanax mexicanus TaxID=7994 RepID=A0A8B9GN06_ASTMX